MRTLTSIFSILALTLAIGCSDDDGGGGGDVDAGATVDAMAAPDAPPASTVADGKACTASAEDPTGGCPATHGCVASKCSELCPLVAGPQPGDPMQPNGMLCTAYTGPGASVCIFSLTTMPMGDPVAAACGIFCEDTMSAIPGCANGVCDGSCPNSLSCQTLTGAPAGTKVCQ